MVSASSLIDFLLNLLKDEQARKEFEEDPEGVLARQGLDGVCGQDIRDVAPLLADHHAVHASGSYIPSGGDDPVREISHINSHYQIDRSVTVYDNDEYNISYVDDRDTTTITADGDVNIEDSFNSDNDAIVIDDSFNQDNDGVDNKGGTIDDSIVAGEDVEDSGNSDDDTTVSDSLNTDNSQTNIDASDDDTALGSFNSDDDVIDADIQVEDSELAVV